MRFLFYKSDFDWPLSSGHDVHTFNMVRALVFLGHEAGLATASPLPAPVLAALRLELAVTLADLGDGKSGLTGLRERFRSYWGVSASRILGFGRLSHEFRPDVVVVTGLETLPLLGDIEGPVRVWYAGDEWFWHHMSQVNLVDRQSWPNVKAAFIKGLYERAFRPKVDRAWVVSDRDARWLHSVAGIRHVDVVPSGVDVRFYQPTQVDETKDTAVFWGRLDFGPNVQALEWFCGNVWPRIHGARPTARFLILGFMPTERVERLARIGGVELRPSVPDIRPEVAPQSVVVLPMVSGGGVKNKLLEAAALGKAIVCTSRALLGLKGTPPLRVADTPDAWREALLAFWDNEADRREAGVRARHWVAEEHTWESAARIVLSGIETSLGERTRP